jgi:dipeptidase
LNLKMEAEELPFSVKPDKKVSVRDIMKMYRETYAGTEYDMTKDLMVKARRSDEVVKSPIANPWMSWDMRSLLNTLKPDVVPNYRTIAIAGCSYSHITQCRGWLPDPIPIFAGVTDLLPSFEVGAQHRFRTDSAAWAFRRANRLATVKWGEAQPYIEGAINEFEEKAFRDLPDVEKKALELYNNGKSEEDIAATREYLTKYTNDFARAAIHKYLELGDTFWHLFGRGF